MPDPLRPIRFTTKPGIGSATTTAMARPFNRLSGWAMRRWGCWPVRVQSHH
ncbi:hypothetical protein [Lysobacter gummosus]|uniref:hypothetical protein n=1 Tax=Lysobacter gummosus TaxID=262324 RepID=UPI00364428A7